MSFGDAARWRKRPQWLPEWMLVAAPTVLVIAGTSLVGILPAVIMTGTKHLTLVAVAAGVPFALLLLMGVVLALVLPGEAGPPGGGGGPPGPSDEPPDEPPWWPAFEKAFRQHVSRRGGEPPEPAPDSSGDRRSLIAS